MITQADQIMRMPLDDLVFENRNKEYGAYVLRKSYSKHLMRAMIVAISLFLLFIFMPTIIRLLTPKEEVIEEPLKEVKYTDLMEPPPLDKNIPPPPPNLPPPPKVNKLTPPKVVEDKDVREEDEIKEIEELKQAPISNTTTEGPVVAPDLNVPVETVIDEPKEDNTVYTSVEQMPVFPGGDAELMNYIKKNLQIPNAAKEAGINGKLFVGFTVNKDGNVTDVRVEKGLGFGLDEAAVRVIQKLPRFTPGKQNGNAVKVRYVWPIKITLQG
jgi:periplasmic protein TonB